MFKPEIPNYVICVVSCSLVFVDISNYVICVHTCSIYLFLMCCLLSFVSATVWNIEVNGSCFFSCFLTFHSILCHQLCLFDLCVVSVFFVCSHVPTPTLYIV